MAIKSGGARMPIMILIILFLGYVTLITDNQYISSWQSTQTSTDISLINQKAKIKFEQKKMQKPTSIDQIQNCILEIFMESFVSRSLNYQFDLNKYGHNCDRKWSISSLLTDLNHALSKFSIKDISNENSNEKYSFHQIIALRRMIMILWQILGSIEFDDEIYDEILQRLYDIETEYNAHHRFNFTLFNIHLPRSGGTKICTFIKKGSNLYPNKIKLNATGTRNCNIGDGLPFTWRGTFEETKPKSCLEQYEMMKGYNFVAREAPLYNNKNHKIYHPELCNKFIYILSFRSPIERIISFMRSYPPKIEIYFNGKQSDDPKYFGSDFFELFFSNKGRSEWMNNTKDNVSFKLGKRSTTTRFGHMYGNNALTKWIGFEHQTQITHGTDIVDIFDTEKIDLMNSSSINDKHFYNAINVLLQIDFVCNFASYPNDTSSIMANKYGSNYNDSVVNSFTIINDPSNVNSMWNIFASFLNKYYNITYFQWEDVERKEHENDPNWRPSVITSALSPKDWRTLYQQNYWDFRLYSMAKWIQTIDAQFYNAYK